MKRDKKRDMRRDKRDIPEFRDVPIGGQTGHTPFRGCPMSPGIGSGTNRFEEYLRLIPSEEKRWRGAVINAADSAFMAMCWLQVYAPNYTAADVIALAELIIRCGRVTAFAKETGGDDRPVFRVVAGDA